MKKRIGRPPLGKDKARGELFGVRLNPIEAKAVREAISKSGQSNADWLRQALLKATGK